MATDAERLEWLEDQHGLHRGADITYVVDGYEIEFTYDGDPTDGNRYHGETLRDAIDKAMGKTPNDQAHRRLWSVAEKPSGAAPC